MPVIVNVYATCREVPPPPFPHERLSHRDRTDPELREHLQGFIGYIMAGGERAMTQPLYHVLRHIERVRNHFSLSMEEADLDELAHWSRAANGILFTPDGAVRDPSGRVLVDPETGKPERGVMVPYPQDAITRKLRIDAELRGKGIPVASSLPPVVGEDEVVLRSATAVAERALALLLVALRAESVRQGDAVSRADLERRLPGAELSPLERLFVRESAPQDDVVVDFVWRYEALGTLLWALGRLAALPPASQATDASQTSAAVVNVGADALVKHARLRPTPELLDAVDRHLRLHWAAREASQQGQPPPADLDPSVLQERHRALNWLTSFEDAPWDDVDTPT